MSTKSIIPDVKVSKMNSFGNSETGTAQLAAHHEMNSKIKKRRNVYKCEDDNIGNRFEFL